MTIYRTREAQLAAAGRPSSIRPVRWEKPQEDAVLEDQDKGELVRQDMDRFSSQEIHRILSRVMLGE